MLIQHRQRIVSYDHYSFHYYSFHYYFSSSHLSKSKDVSMIQRLKKYCETMLACARHNERLDHSLVFFELFDSTGTGERERREKIRSKNQQQQQKERWKRRSISFCFFFFRQQHKNTEKMETGVECLVQKTTNNNTNTNTNTNTNNKQKKQTKETQLLTAIPDLLDVGLGVASPTIND